MPLNISIDVDETLLDENGDLIPQVREKLLQLKSKGHRLQLWSTGGADYAIKTAMKFELTDLFDSYATKPDVAIDDIPGSALPVAILKVDKAFRLCDAIAMLQTDLENCIEAAILPNRELVGHVAEIQETFATIPQQTRQLLSIKPCPIPFFGNLDHARIVTVGLNPSSTEFAEWRGWDAKCNLDELTSRLVNYFRLANVKFPPPHAWFGEILEASYILRCPHAIAAVHVDLCPWATIAPTTLCRLDREQPLQNGTTRREIFWNFIDNQMSAWLGKTIRRCCNSAKLVVILQSNNPTDFELARQARAKEIINAALGQGWQGTLEIKSKEQLSDWTLQNKDELRALIDFPNVIA